jgi:hypothetical protein
MEQIGLFDEEGRGMPRAGVPSAHISGRDGLKYGILKL